MPKRHRDDFEPVFSANALETFLQLSKSRQRKVAKIAWQLAMMPLRKPDYFTSDSTGRSLSNAVIQGYVFTYWADPWPQELRIIDLVEL
jgi:hypothetical protein